MVYRELYRLVLWSGCQLLPWQVRRVFRLAVDNAIPVGVVFVALFYDAFVTSVRPLVFVARRKNTEGAARYCFLEPAFYGSEDTHILIIAAALALFK